MQWAGKPAAEGAAGGGAGGPAGQRQRRRRPVVLLDGHAAVQAAVGRRYSASKERYMPERFYAYADANAGRTALTEEARRGAMDCIHMMCGAKTKKHAVLAGEIGAMDASAAAIAPSSPARSAQWPRRMRPATRRGSAASRMPSARPSPIRGPGRPGGG